MSPHSSDGIIPANVRELTQELAHLRPDETYKHARTGRIPGTIELATDTSTYIAVPLEHPYNREARAMCAYGMQGRKATYLTGYDALRLLVRVDLLQKGTRKLIARSV